VNFELKCILWNEGGEDVKLKFVRNITFQHKLYSTFQIRGNVYQLCR